MARHRPLITGLGAGALALGVDYLAHAFLAVPLLPEQAGYLLLKVLPLSTFANLLKLLGVLARPLLLLGATVVIIALYLVAAVVGARLFPRIYVAVVTALAVLVGALVTTMAFSPGDSAIGVVVEVVLLAATIPLVDRVIDGFVSEGTVNEDRRILLRNLFYGAVGIAVLGLGYVNVRRFTTALAITQGNHAGTEITDVNDFYVVEKDLGGGPVVNASTWRLNLPTRSLTYQELLAMPAQQLELTLECISNDVGGTLISNGLWRGPRVSDLLALTTVPSDAVWMLMESADGYTESFRLSELTPDHMLATHLNGAPLTPEHGFPARFLFPGHYGMKQPKWVTRIRFSATDQPGYWENNGWDERAIIKTMSRIDRPSDGAALAAGSIQFGGIAFAGSRRINAVELSWDGGRSWQPAELQAEFAPNAWRFWQLAASLPAGHYNVSVRARDGEGTLQTSKATGTLPNGADGYHSITLDLA
ncbi:MAG TPA: molybdopterin-dependent oxidoreductase [Candidatus Dormibacteraeota bacterium]